MSLFASLYAPMICGVGASTAFFYGSYLVCNGFPSYTKIADRDPTGILNLRSVRGLAIISTSAIVGGLCGAFWPIFILTVIGEVSLKTMKK